MSAEAKLVIVKYEQDAEGCWHVHVDHEGVSPLEAWAVLGEAWNQLNESTAGVEFEPDDEDVEHDE